MNRQSVYPVDEDRLTSAVRQVLQEEGIRWGTVSLAVVDDPTIHQLNRRYLQHDQPTDVLSFVLDQDGGHLEGEILVSADTAAARAGHFGWSAGDELLLYVIHGALHLVGYDDATAAGRSRMRDRERHYLARYDLEPRYDEPGPAGPDAGRPEAGEGGGA